MQNKIQMFNLKFMTTILTLSVVLRFVFFITFLSDNTCMLKFDSEHYHKIALNIISGNGISNDIGAPQFYRVPGYPIFLAGCYKIFGTIPIFVIFIQILLSALISILIFWLALIIFRKQFGVARLASIISLFDIGYAIFPGLILTETLFVLLFTIFLILFLRNLNLFFEKKQIANINTFELLIAGLFLGLACIVRQVASAMVGVSIFLLVLSQEKFKSVMFFATGFLLGTGWWLVRNFILTGYIFWGTLSGPHFLNHAVVQLEMMHKKVSYEHAKVNVQKEFNNRITHKQVETGRHLSEIERCYIAEKLTMQYSLNHPITAMRLYLKNIFKTIFGLYSSELLFIDSKGWLPEYSINRNLKTMVRRFLCPHVSNFWIIPIIYFEILMFIFILIGFSLFLFSAFFNFEKFCIMCKIIPFMCATVFITLACGYARLRLPIECFLIILASKAWFDFLKG